MKKTVALFLCFVWLLSLVPGASAAADQSLDQALINAATTGEETDLSEFSLSEDQLNEAITRLYHTGRMPWFFVYDMQYKTRDDGVVVSVDLKGLSEQGLDGDLYEQKLAELIHATVLPGMSDLEKVLSVHDYMAANISYDTTLQKNSAYYALVEGTSACEGYAKLYLDVLRRVDVPCQIASCDDTGDGIGHAWNMVQLDGSWYHVDVTWDDPTPNTQGRVMHTHFLRSDKQYKAQEDGHNVAWTAYEKCDGGKYDSNMPWDSVEGAICFAAAGSAYYSTTDQGITYVHALDTAALSSHVICQSEDGSIAVDGGVMYFPCVGLSLYNDRLYFHTPKSVYSVNTQGQSLTTEYTMDAARADLYILGAHVSRGTLYLTACDMDMVPQELAHTLQDQGYHTHSYVQAEQIQASCRSAGGTKWVCECGASYIEASSDPLPHSFTQTQEDGRTRYVCQDCGYSYMESERQVAEEEASLWWLWVAIGVVALVLLVAIFKKRR